MNEISAFPQRINFVESDPPSTSNLMGIELFPRLRGFVAYAGPTSPVTGMGFLKDLSSDPR